MAKRALESRGFQVLIAANGKDAVQLVTERNDELKLVILDLTMPVISGEETFSRLQEIRKDVPILLCSGLGETEALERFAGQTLVGFLQKPYSGRKLAEQVKAALLLKH